MDDKPYITPEEYLKAERIAEARHEYFAGEIVAMAGTSRRHSQIVSNILYRLRLKLDGKPCEVHVSDLRLRIDADGTYTYPDISVTCGEPEFEDKELDTLLNPTVLIEVLSKPTEDRDRGGKFESYHKLPSLTDYVLVSQERRLVEHRARQSENTWLMNIIEGANGILRLDSLGCDLTLADVYERVELDSLFGGR